MLKWMAWMLTPEVQTQVAEYFGEAPANPKACKYLDVGYGSYKLADFCTAYGVNDPSFYNAHRVLEDPAAGLRHGRHRSVHRLLRLDPEVDGDQGLSPIPSRRGAAGTRSPDRPASP